MRPKGAKQTQDYERSELVDLFFRSCFPRVKLRCIARRNRSSEGSAPVTNPGQGKARGGGRNEPSPTLSRVVLPSPPIGIRPNHRCFGRRLLRLPPASPPPPCLGHPSLARSLARACQRTRAPHGRRRPSRCLSCAVPGRAKASGLEGKEGEVRAPRQPLGPGMGMCEARAHMLTGAP